jgi:Fe-S-cluster-containing hydrogenase component 2
MSSEVYNKLSERLDFPSSEHLPQILERMFTPEEGQLVLELPARNDAIAMKLGMDEEVVKKKLQELMLRGVIYPGRQGFVFGPTFEHLRAMFLTTAEKFMSAESLEELMDMWKEFYKAEWCEAQGKFYGEDAGLAMRVIPARKAFQRTPEISPAKILPYEDLKRILESADVLCVIPCVCKFMWRKCNAPVEVCLQMNQWAQFTMAKGAGRKVTLEEALAISDSAEEAGLVHTMATAGSFVMCNCCSDCCIVIDPARKYGTLNQAVVKSHYRSDIDQDSCAGCETCAELCPFGAITMEEAPSSKELKAAVELEKCFGCGACAVACPSEAITMRPVEI